METEAKTTPDVLVHNEETVFLFCPLTPQAKEWIDAKLVADFISAENVGPKR
jgi:hypothetical protein